MKVCSVCGKQWSDDARFCTADGTLLMPIEADPLGTLIGKVLNRTYKIEAKLGQGGVGAVFRAKHLGIGDTVALKVISPEHTQNSDTLKRFRREAQAARRLAHPNAVAVHDFNMTEDGLLFMVMEYVDGITLEQYLKEHAPLTPKRALEILRPVAAALDVAHSLGIVHRDLKPANLMLSKDTAGKELIKVLDFGTARLTVQDDDPKISGGVSITHHGQLFGTPVYMSPEQASDGPITATTDIYALGVILYQMLTGSVPFFGKQTFHIIMDHINTAPELPSTRHSELSSEFDPVVMKALEKLPENRFQTANALVDELALTIATQESRLYVSTTFSTNVASTELYTAATEPISSKDLRLRNTHGSRGSRLQVNALRAPDFDQFVGRENELQRLQNEYLNALEGRGRPTFIYGSPGSGKTQLTIKLRDWATAEGAMVLSGKFFDYGGSVIEPLRLFKNLLASTLSGELSYSSAGEQFRRRYGVEMAVNEGMSVDVADKWQGFAQLTSAFMAVARLQPVLLILDDLQWADSLSLDFLGYLLRNTEQLPFCFVGVARAEEATSKGHPFREWFVTQTRYLHYERIELLPFDTQTIQLLLQAIFQSVEISQEDIEVLHKITDGNPFYLGEVIRLLVDTQKITFQNGIWSGAAFDQIKLPDSISNIVKCKLESCSEQLRELLTQAAVIGDEVRFELLQMVSGLEEADIEKLLMAGVKAFLLREETGASGDDYRFYNSTVRRVIYDEIPKRQRRRLHSRVASALAELNRGKIHAVSGALTYHYHAAGEWEQAFKYGFSAVEQAWRQQAMGEVIRLSKCVEEALSNLESERTQSDRQRMLGQLKLRRTTALMRLARFDEAEREIDQMRDFIKNLGDKALLARLYLMETELCYWSNRYADGVSIGSTGLALAREAGDGDCARQIMFFLAWCQARISNIAEAVGLFEELCVVAERAGDIPTQAGAMCGVGFWNHFSGQWRKARACLRKALEIARTCNDRYVECMAFFLSAWLMEYECQADELIKFYQDGIKVARTCSWRNFEGYLHFVAGRHYLWRIEPDYGQAEELLSRSMAIMQETHDLTGQMIVSHPIALMRLRTDPSLEALEQLRAISNTFTQYKETINNCEIICEVGEAAQQLDNWEDALKTYQQGLKLADSIPYADYQWRAHYGLARCYQHEGNDQAALEHLSQAIAIINKLQQEFDTPEAVNKFLEDKQDVYITYAQLCS
ncbi:MAG: protein kinase [Acidobacteriota bacterium]